MEEYCGIGSLLIGRRFGRGPKRHKPLNVHATASGRLAGDLIDPLGALRADQNPALLHHPFTELCHRAVFAPPTAAGTGSVMHRVRHVEIYEGGGLQAVILALSPY